MQQPKHWQDVVNAVLGLWVIISPWVLGFDGSSMAMSNAVVVGVLLVATALGAVFVPRAWEEWTEAGIGLWLVVSPWILGFSGHRNAMLSTVIAGAIVVAMALWTLFTDKDYSAAWREPMAH
jgi:SPW repeat